MIKGIIYEQVHTPRLEQLLLCYAVLSAPFSGLKTLADLTWLLISSHYELNRGERTH